MAGQVFPAAGAPFLGAGARVIASPFQFVGDADTFLRVVSVCSVPGVTLAVQGRRLDSQGELMAITEAHTPNSDRSTKTSELKLGDGALLNLTVFARAGTPRIGECYVMIQLLRSSGATAIVLGTLLGGYVTATQAIGFPGSPVQSSTEGEPALRTVSGTVPILGADMSELVPSGARWELLLFGSIFAASATVAARVPRLEFVTGGATMCGSTQIGSIAAGAAPTVCWGTGLGAQAPAGVPFLQAPLPTRTLLLAGNIVASHTVNMQAGDQWSAPTYQVREWLEVQ